MKTSGQVDLKRKYQNQSWFKKIVEELLKKSLMEKKSTKDLYLNLIDDVSEDRESPLEAARKVIADFLS